MKKRLIYIAVGLLLVVYLIKTLSVIFRLVVEDIKAGTPILAGAQWKTILMPAWLRNPEDTGWRLDAVGSVVAALLSAYLIVKRKIPGLK
jgi:hypothetical protein